MHSQQKPVLCLSTFLNARNEQRDVRGREKTKPAMIFEYNRHMGGGGIDLSDKKFVIWRQRGQLGGTGSRSSGILLDVAVLNWYEICKLSTPVALHMWGVEWGVREAGWKLECCVWRGP